MYRYYSNDSMCSLRKTCSDSVDPITGRVKFWDHDDWERTASKEEWGVFMIGAREVPGLLWHFQVKKKLQDELKRAQTRLESAEYNFAWYLERYSTEADLAISHKIESEPPPGVK